MSPGPLPGRPPLKTKSPAQLPRRGRWAIVPTDRPTSLECPAGARQCGIVTSSFQVESRHSLERPPILNFEAVPRSQCATASAVQPVFALRPSPPE